MTSKFIAIISPVLKGVISMKFQIDFPPFRVGVKKINLKLFLWYFRSVSSNDLKIHRNYFPNPKGSNFDEFSD